MSTTIGSVEFCPFCSRAISFTSTTNTLIVCSSCKKTVVRDAYNRLSTQPIASIEQAVSVIQPGTTGVWKGKKFRVLGRIRAWFEESVFSYWTILTEDGKIAWMGEGYGIYSIVQTTELGKTVSHRQISERSIGDVLDITQLGKTVLEQKYYCSFWELEGESFFPYPKESSFRVFEFASATGQHIMLLENAQREILTYSIDYTQFESLKLSNLRAFQSWPMDFTCVTCSATVRVKTFPYSQCCACTACGSMYTRSKDRSKFNLANKADSKAESAIPIGSEGLIMGISYTVIGVIEKQEVSKYKSRWREYSLFNHEHGFAFLSEYDGNWIYVKETGDSPVLINQNTNSFTYKHEPFELFNKYNYTIVVAAGEFPTNSFDNNEAKAREFISPPEMWIEERNKQEGIIWFHARHVNRKTIEKNFSGTVLPPKYSVGAIEPSNFISPYKLLVTGTIACLILLFAHLATGLAKQNKVLLDESFSFNDSTNKFATVTPRFDLNKSVATLEFNINAPVYNNWFELSATLVNAETGKEYSFSKGVEYYAGYTDGEHWSEGGTSETAFLANIPKGKYFFQLEGTRSPTGDKLSSFTVKIIYDNPNHVNLAVGIGIIVLAFALAYLLINIKEKRRWANSPLSE